MNATTELIQQNEITTLRSSDGLLPGLSWSQPIISLLPKCFTFFAGLIFFGALESNCEEAPYPPLPRINLGVTVSLSGPRSELGKELLQGMQTALRRSAYQNHVGKTSLEIVTRDDLNEVRKITNNVRELLETERALALLGITSAEGLKVVGPLAFQNNTLCYSPFASDTEVTLSSDYQHLFSLRPSLATEIRTLLDWSLYNKALVHGRTAIIAEKDKLGDDAAAIFERALKERFPSSSPLVLRVEPNSLAVEDAVADLLLEPTEPEIMVVAMSYEPAARFINLLEHHQIRTTLLALSTTTTQSMINRLSSTTNKLILSQVVPDPLGKTRLATKFREDYALSYPPFSPTATAFEGYAALQVVIQAISKVEGIITREKLLISFNNLGSITLDEEWILQSPGKTPHLGNRVWLAEYANQGLRYLDSQTPQVTTSAASGGL